MGRIATGWQLAKRSLAVVRSDRSLSVLVILGGALVLTTVNLVLQALRERTGPLGGILLGAASVAWGLATFLVVPIVALTR